MTDTRARFEAQARAVSKLCLQGAIYKATLSALQAATDAAIERCAEIAEQHDHGHNKSTCKLIAAAIRARGENPAHERG